MFLVIIGCGTASVTSDPDYSTKVSLAFGLGVMSIACFTGHISGGNLNPAVSLGLLVGGQLSLIKAIFYIVAQTVGAIAGAAVLHFASLEKWSLGVNTVNAT